MIKFQLASEPGSINMDSKKILRSMNAATDKASRRHDLVPFSETKSYTEAGFAALKSLWTKLQRRLNGIEPSNDHELDNAGI